MSDIVERLRSVVRLLRETDEMMYDQDDELANQAADEIERLRAALRETLEIASRNERGDFIDRARAALEGK